MPAPTLAETIAQYGHDAYLLTIANDGPHTSFVSVDLKGNVIACAIGKVCSQEHCQQAQRVALRATDWGSVLLQPSPVATTRGLNYSIMPLA